MPSEIATAELNASFPSNRRQYRPTLERFLAARIVMESYSYKPFDDASRQIRLFILLPSADKFSQLYGHLRTAYLQPHKPTALDYEALSYAWGAQTKNHPLQIREQELSISDSLATALFHLRHQSEPRVLWIDAICIDISKYPPACREFPHIPIMTFCRAFSSPR